MQTMTMKIRAAITLSVLSAACATAAPAPAPPVAGSALTADTGTLVLLGTTDLHGWVLPYDYYTGKTTNNSLASLVPMIDSVRAANPGRTILVESGDLLQGNPLDFVYSRLQPGETHPLVAAMNLVGYDAAAIGNHEFNYGIAHLETAMRQARFPWLSANVFRAGTNEHAFRAYTIVQRTIAGHPLKVGITSATPPGVAIWDRDNVRGKLDFRDIVASVRPVVAQMRAEGADLVIVAAHSGLEGSSYDTAATHVAAENASVAMAQQIPGIDVILMGHTHREVQDTTINGVLVQQAKNWGASLAVSTLTLSHGADGWRVLAKQGRILRPVEGRVDTRLTTALAEAHERTRQYVGRQIGTSTDEWTSALSRTRDTPITDLINDVERRVTGADLASTAAFSLNSRIPRGPITVADVAGLYIYDNTLKAVRISGAQLRAYIEKSAEYYLPCPGARCERVTSTAVPGYNFDVVSGVDYALDLTKPVGQRVVKLERNGRAVAATDSFTIALNNYRASGSGGFSMLIGAPVVYDRGESIRDLLIAEIQRRGRISPADVFRRNWEILPAALADQAAAEQRNEGAQAH